MRAEQLVAQAMALKDHLKSTGHLQVECEHEPSRGLFINNYQAALPKGSGVYLFHFDDNEVFYIGKTDAKRDDFARIWSHLGSAPEDISPSTPGFPHSKFAERAGNKSLEDIRAGQFRIEFLIVQPKYLASLFEVYLQTVYALSEGGLLPECNKQFG